jgi:hypothetical protein
MEFHDSNIECKTMHGVNTKNSHSSIFTPGTLWMGDLMGFRGYLGRKAKRKK